MIWVLVEPVTSETWSRSNETAGARSKDRRGRDEAGGVSDMGGYPVIPVLPTGCCRFWCFFDAEIVPIDAIWQKHTFFQELIQELFYMGQARACGAPGALALALGCVRMAYACNKLNRANGVIVF